MSSLDHTEIQKDEVKALRSIFGNEFKLHRPKNLKKKFEPPHLSILIACSASNDIPIISVKLWFDCSATYPYCIPVISMTDAEYVSVDEQSTLLSLLQLRSKELLGKQMIHQLVETAREFLNELRKPVILSQSVAKEQKIIDIENKQRGLKLQLLRERKNSAKKDINHVKFNEKCIYPSHTDSMLLKFEHCGDKVPIDVYRGTCDGTHEVTSIIDDGRMVTVCFEGFHVTKGCGVKINQVSLQNLTKKSLDNHAKNLLSKLEEDFYFLYKLSHCNVLPYLAFRQQITEKLINNDRTFELDIQYVTPNICAMSLRSQCAIDTAADQSVQSTVQLSMDKIRLYVAQVLDGIRYLHEKNVTNIKINLDSIFVGRDLKLKITHYYIGKRFEELKIPKQRDNSASAAKKGSKRRDIMNVGKLAKQLFFFGWAVNQAKEEEIPCELMGFIDGARSNLSDLNNHPFICPPKRSKDTLEEHGNDFPIDDLSAWERFDKSSRIPTEFALICKLGEGAFGDVVKVKNIYDLQYYAIKRVRLNALRAKASRRTMKEVQLLSTLNHENIIRYYASWSEEVVISDCDLAGPLPHTMRSSSIMNNLSIRRSFLTKHPIDSSLFEMEEVSAKVTSDFFNHNAKSNTRHFYDIESNSDDSSSCTSSDNEESCSTPCVTSHGYVNENAIEEAQPPPNKKYKFLMIQMELCEGPCNTLQRYIEEEKLYLNEKLIWKFIREMVSGLDHIHSKNMIHRDLKPTNVFIDHQKKVKIGDLGLATSLISKSSINPLDESGVISSDQGLVGTWLYICPEMISHKPYDNKVDMYSLGVIIFEMCHAPFGTCTERYKVLGLIRQPEIIFPEDKEFKMHDKFKQLISSLLNHDSTQRPSASDLLRSNIIPPPEAREMELRQGLKEITRDRSSNIYKLLLTNLFNQSSATMRGYELPLMFQSPYKYYISNTKPHLLRHNNRRPQLQIDEGDYTFFTTKRLIIRSFESVFISHGAVEFMAPMLSQKPALKESKAFTVLDCEGVIVNLPTNLRDNFASFLLNNDIDNSRRYAIGSIYHEQEYRRDHPQELLEAAFDIVCDYESCHKSAESLYILHEVFSKLFNREQMSLNLEINHTKLLGGIMKYYRIPEHIQQEILSRVCEKTDHDMVYLDSDEVKHNTSLPDSQVNHLKSILTYCGRLEDLEKFLKIYLNKAEENPSCKAISDAFNELLSITEMLERFPAPLCFNVSVRPSFVPKQSLYTGFVFQLLAQIQDKFVDSISPAKNTNTIVRYLKNMKQVSLGGDYSHYLMATPQQLVSEDGDISRNVSAVGLSIDLSTVIQTVYLLEQMLLTEAEGKYDCVNNSAISVVVQYDSYFDNRCRELLSSLWKSGLATILYDRVDSVEEFALQNKIEFVVKFLRRDDRRSVTDYRIIVNRNDRRGMGLEQISTDDCKTVARAVEVLIKEHRKKDTFLSKLNKEFVLMSQKPPSEPTTPEANQDVENKRPFTVKSESASARYVYVFVTVKDNRDNKFELKYLAETHRQIQSLRQKMHVDIDSYTMQSLLSLNKRLLAVSKWFQGKLPTQIYMILVEMAYDKCVEVIAEMSIKSLKDPTKLALIISNIESSVNYNSNNDRHWKDVLNRMWKEIQKAVNDKIYKLLVHSLSDDNFVFVDIK